MLRPSLSHSVREWLIPNWFLAGLVACCFLLAITPILWHLLPHALVLVYLQLPVYMLHQVEEHYHDRFRLAINVQLAGGRDALTHDAVLVVNLGGVWLFDLVALYLAFFFGAGAGLIAMYLAIVNGLIHIVPAIVRRAYNPGVITAALLLVPFGAASARFLAVHAEATFDEQMWGLGVAIALHAAIAAGVAHRVRWLNRHAAEIG